MTRITRRAGDPRTEPTLRRDHRPERGLAIGLICGVVLTGLLVATVAVIWTGGGL